MYKQLNSYSQRHNWKIKIAAPKLLEACQERMKYHEARLSWWQEQAKMADKELRDRGMKIEAFPISGGANRVEVTTNSSMANRLGECMQKVREHQDNIDRFRAYQSLFKLSLTAEYELNVDDVLYFNLGNADSGMDDSDGVVDQD